MASKATTVVVIYDQVLYNPGGHVSRWAHAAARSFVRYAKAEAPARTGELREGILSDVDRVGPRRMIATIESTAPHTGYVIFGTTGPIMSRRMWGFRQRTGLRFPRGGVSGPLAEYGIGEPNLTFLHSKGYALRVRPGKGFPQRYAVSVSGQEPNNFMARAAARTAVRNSSLRGWAPDVVRFRA